MKLALELILAERKRQVEVEGWSFSSDDKYQNSGELAKAAACYALAPYIYDINSPQLVNSPFKWPWGTNYWKPTPDDRIRELVKAGALIVAEIERIQRKEGIHEY